MSTLKLLISFAYEDNVSVDFELKIIFGSVVDMKSVARLSIVCSLERYFLLSVHQQSGSWTCWRNRATKNSPCVVATNKLQRSIKITDQSPAVQVLYWCGMFSNLYTYTSDSAVFPKRLRYFPSAILGTFILHHDQLHLLLSGHLFWPCCDFKRSLLICEF